MENIRNIIQEVIGGLLEDFPVNIDTVFPEEKHDVLKFIYAGEELKALSPTRVDIDKHESVVYVTIGLPTGQKLMFGRKGNPLHGQLYLDGETIAHVSSEELGAGSLSKLIVDKYQEYLSDK